MSEPLDDEINRVVENAKALYRLVNPLAPLPPDAAFLLNLREMLIEGRATVQADGRLRLTPKGKQYGHDLNFHFQHKQN